MNKKELDDLMELIATLAENAREAERAVSLLAGEIEAMRRRLLNMKKELKK